MKCAKMRILCDLGGTPGSPLPPPGPSGCIISLAFSVIEFPDEKLL